MSLPLDLFYSYIIPDILSEHLHQLLTGDAIPGWHPFYTLPLVSQSFRTMCKMLYTHIFDVGQDESTDKILNVFRTASELWDKARLPLGSPPILDPETDQPYTYRRLTSSKSLIQVYICTAVALSLFKHDVLWSLEREAQDLEAADQNRMDLDWPPRQRKFRMADECMHRVYLPLICAMRLCDRVRPNRLAYIIAKHLADMVPRYSTEPVLLKYTQDLETYITRQHRLDTKTWAEWTSRTLGLIEGTEKLLKNMQGTGKLVKSFSHNSAIPCEVLQDTNIISALKVIMVSDWGPDPDTRDIRGRAADLLDDWGVCPVECV